MVAQNETHEFQQEALSASCIIRTHGALASQGAHWSEDTDIGCKSQPGFAKPLRLGILSMGMSVCTASMVLSVSNW